MPGTALAAGVRLDGLSAERLGAPPPEGSVGWAWLLVSGATRRIEDGFLVRPLYERRSSSAQAYAPCWEIAAGLAGSVPAPSGFEWILAGGSDAVLYFHEASQHYAAPHRRHVQHEHSYWPVRQREIIATGATGGLEHPRGWRLHADELDAWPLYLANDSLSLVSDPVNAAGWRARWTPEVLAAAATVSEWRDSWTEREFPPSVLQPVIGSPVHTADDLARAQQALQWGRGLVGHAWSVVEGLLDGDRYAERLRAAQDAMSAFREELDGRGNWLRRWARRIDPSLWDDALAANHLSTSGRLPRTDRTGAGWAPSAESHADLSPIPSETAGDPPLADVPERWADLIDNYRAAIDRYDLHGGGDITRIRRQHA